MTTVSKLPFINSKSKIIAIKTLNQLDFIWSVQWTIIDYLETTHFHYLG